MNTSRRCAFSIPLLPMVTCSMLALTSCASSTVGEVDGGLYTAPNDVFSMPLPALSLGLVVEDDFVKSPDGLRQAGFVSFHDDFGHLRAVEYEEFPEVSAEMRTPQALSNYFNDQYLAELRQGIPGVTEQHAGPLSLHDGTRGWFAVLEIPEGSPMIVMNAEHPEGRRLDSTRAFLLLFHEDLFLTLSAADDAVLGRGVLEAGAGGSEMELLKRTVADLYESMRFD